MEILGSCLPTTRVIDGKSITPDHRKDKPSMGLPIKSSMKVSHCSTTLAERRH